MQKRVKIEGPWPASVTKKDLEITWFNGSKGGQNVNKHANCCRIKHIPTGIIAQCKDHKERPPNQQEAFSRLAEKLVPIMKSKLKTYSPEGRPTEEVRVYKEKHDRVIDKRVDKQFSYKKVLAGELDEIHA